jgi:hypothetical protein
MPDERKPPTYFGAPRRLRERIDRDAGIVPARAGVANL